MPLAKPSAALAVIILPSAIGRIWSAAPIPATLLVSSLHGSARSAFAAAASEPCTPVLSAKLRPLCSTDEIGFATRRPNPDSDSAFWNKPLA